MSKKTGTKSSDDPQAMRGAILDAVLDAVPFDGWNARAVAHARRELGLSQGFVELAFPRGIRDMVDLYLKRADEELETELARRRLVDMKIRERIATAVRVRLRLHQNQRDVIERTLAWLALPPNQPLGARSLWRTADVMWRAAGDTSTDYNWYTKRAILSGVYSSTLLYWLQDGSEDFKATWAFLDRRIGNVMQFEKAKAKARDARARLPDIWKIFGRWRYPDAHPPE